MLISHKQTGTIGDLATSFPALSSLSKLVGPIDLTLSKLYDERYFNGLKEFLEYQDFVGTVDFNDRDGDFDLQCHPRPNPQGKLPLQQYFVKSQIFEILKLDLEVDQNFKLKVPYIEVPEEIKNKNIIVDRVKTGVLKKTGLFNDENENFWLKTNKPNEIIGDSIIYNINICLQTKKELITTPTGLPIILQYFDKPMKIYQLCNDGIWAKDFAYFTNNKNLTFIDMLN
jgi:hypothetical protein